MGDNSQKLHLCLAYRLLHTNCTDSSTLLAVLHSYTPLNKGLINFLAFWTSWVLWISWPEFYKFTSFIGFLSFQSFYCSQGGKVSIWKRGKRLGWGVGSNWGDPMPQWRSSEKVTGEETQFDAWMQHLGWRIWHSWIPRPHHNFLDRS